MSGKNASAASAPPELTADSETKPESAGTSIPWIRGAALLAAAAGALWLARGARA
jgi:hypothetical protein